MKWIKASERLPEKRQIVIVKIVTENEVTIHSDGYVDDFTKEVRWFLGDYRTNFPVKMTSNVVEWLDETPIPEDDQDKLWEEVLKEFLPHHISDYSDSFLQLKSKYTITRKQ